MEVRARPLRRLAAIALALALALNLAACSPARLYEAALVLGDLAAAGGASRLGDRAAPPTRTPVRYAVEGRPYAGDLYLPGGEPALAPLVLAPGLTPDGKDDPRIVALAATLARARFAVLVPDLDNFRALQVDPQDSRDIGDAVLHLAAATGRPAVALAAISYAVGPAILALLDPAVDRQTGLVVAIGGYHRIESVVAFFTTGAYRLRAEEPWSYREPNTYGKWVFVRGNAPRLPEARDRVNLAAMAARREADPAAPIEDLAAGLGPDGRAIYRLVTNGDPDRVPALMAELPEALRRDMAALDLGGRPLGGLSPRFILVHGRDDPIIPETESVALAERLPAGRTELHLVDNLAHADIGPGGWLDILTLWRAVYDVLAWRDSFGAPVAYRAPAETVTSAPPPAAPRPARG